MIDFLVEMRGITKRYPGVIALDGVDFDLRAGEVHVLLGENGAGKSTLIKVLSCAEDFNTGTIMIDGDEVLESNPILPLSMGLRFIYQEINLIQELDIARNMFLGMEPTYSRVSSIIDQNSLYQQAGDLLKKFHIDLDPRTIVAHLSVTEQKMVEIARALATDAKGIILDEPTDVLEEKSRADLFNMIRRLKAEHQVGFIYITHRYREIHEIGDRVTILRDGKLAGTFHIDDLNIDQLIDKMVGGQQPTASITLADPVELMALEVEGLSTSKKLNNVSLNLRKGELLAVTGLMGSGKSELGRAIAGIDPIIAGKIMVNGVASTKQDPRSKIKDGVAYLTEDRKGEGLILDHSIRDNFALPNIDRMTNKMLIDHDMIDSEVDDAMKQFVIKAPDHFTKAGQLSGGNQQKLVIAKWLATNCTVLIFDEPTRGIDVLGRHEVYAFMQKLASQGVAILMLTSDYAEALSMSHRLIVMHDGEIAKEFARGEVAEEQILKVAIGATE